jgi:hypothetical protein
MYQRKGTAESSTHSRPNAARNRIVWRYGWLATGLAGLFVALAPISTKIRAAQTVAYRNTAPGVVYVGSRACAVCHKDVYDRYLKTDMGRSMAVPGDPSQLKNPETPVTIFSEKLNRHFRVFREGKDLYQSEYELDSNGKDVFRNTQKIEYVIGAGANGFSYVVRRGDYLFQAPLSFYSRPQKWDLSPGYEFNDYGFSRPILAGCIVCHSGQPQPVPQRHGLYRNPPFRELSIGCENCHGPGDLHVRERGAGVAVSGTLDRTIVNPARLPGWLADNLCMNCHQAGDARVLQPGKDYFDFRPGTPLDETITIFKLPIRREAAPDSDLLEHYSSMTLSACYRQSAGKLRCSSCHDPHEQPDPQHAAAYFRKRCLTCHTEKSCSVPLEKRRAEKPPDDCARCHLPKRDIVRISHSALTNHRIVRRPGAPLPESAFPGSGSGLQDLVHVNAVPGRSAEAIPRLTLLQAYGELSDSHPEYRPRYLELLDQVETAYPTDPLVLSALARRASIKGTTEARTEAMRFLARAIKAGSTNPGDYKDYADMLAQEGRVPEAIELLQRGVALAPYTSVLYKALALHYIKASRYPEALVTMKQALALFPEDSLLRKLVQQAEAARPVR